MGIGGTDLKSTGKAFFFEDEYVGAVKSASKGRGARGRWLPRAAAYFRAVKGFILKDAKGKNFQRCYSMEWNAHKRRQNNKKKPDKTRRIRLFDGALGQSLQQEGICTCFKLKDTQTFMIPQRFSRKLPVPLLAFGLGSLVQLGMVGRKMLAGWTLAVPFRIKDRCKQTQRAQEGACFLSSWRRVCRLLRGGSRFQRIARRVKTFSRHFWA